MQEYPVLDNLMGEYFNQDADLITGSTELGEMIDYYLRDVSPTLLCGLIGEIDAFRSEHSADLDRAFAQRYPDDLDMSPVDAFFDALLWRAQKVLAES